HVSAAMREYHFDIDPKLGDAYSPDCQNVKEQRRFLSLVGNSLNTSDDSGPSMPGPLIEADEGDTIRITVTNHHTSLSHTIHYHGLHMIDTPWADGPSGITQCGLGPGQSQTAEFIAYPPGTHYWHGHLGLDVPDGVTGPIIIHPKEPEPFDYDDERVLFLQDFYTQTGTQQQIGLENYPFTWVGNPTSLLINGKGRAPSCLEGGGNFGDESACLSTCNDTLAWISNVSVDPGKTYRLRIINSASLVMMNIAFQDHNFTIVELDGTPVTPVSVQSYDLAPGQRASVLMTMSQTLGNFWISTSVRMRDIPDLTGRAILSYSNSEIALPNEENLPIHPAWDEEEEAKALQDMLTTLNVSDYGEEEIALLVDDEVVDRYVVVGTQNTRLDDNGDVVQLKWAVNNISLVESSEPLIGTAVQQARSLGWPLQQSLEGTVDLPRVPPTDWNWTQPLQDEGGPGGNLGSVGMPVIRTTMGEVVEIVFQNTRALNGVAEFHPWHFHGHSFWEVGRGYGTFDEERDVPNYNLENPTLRDTFTLWPLEWVAIRFIANNPGVWFFHCHISSHHVMGMGFVVITDPGDIGTPSESVEFCGKQNLQESSAEEALGGGNENTGGNGSSATSIVHSLKHSLSASLMLVTAILTFRGYM
ncbi:MAG: hypothetical protein SGILL_007048, partial [Bacillariaceae sp.]